MILASLTFTYKRSTVVDFVHMPVAVNRLVGAYYYTGSSKLNWHFTKPFQYEIWGFLGLAILISIGALSLIRDVLRTYNGRTGSSLSTIAKSALLITGASLRQGKCKN